jgi:hypothetical protein
MILIIRGHIRESFNNKNLYNLTKEIYKICPELQIFIHTWNIFSNNISWKIIKYNKEEVTTNIINDYFDDLNHLLHIIIDDDTKIKIIGNVVGKIDKSRAPIIGWKNYWYGKFKISEFIYNKEDIDKKEIVINYRFDIMNNSNSNINSNSIINNNKIIEFIKENMNIQFTKNVFFFDGEKLGLDNLYIGNVETMYKLSKIFLNDMDTIIINNKNIGHPEFLVSRVNNILSNYD